MAEILKRSLAMLRRTLIREVGYVGAKTWLKN